MRQVTFSPGPFLDLYEDGHPPEKDCEEDRRRYRSGLPSKADLENGTLDAASFEEAFQEWLGRYNKEQHLDGKSMADASKEGTFFVGPIRMADDFVEGESIPASTYVYKSFQGNGTPVHSKECFVIDIKSLPCIQDSMQEEVAPQTNESLLSCCSKQTRSDNPSGCLLTRPCQTLPLFVFPSVL